MTVLSLRTINYRRGEVTVRYLLLTIGIVVIILDAWAMKKEYDKENLVGVVYWGFWTRMMVAALT